MSSSLPKSILLLGAGDLGTALLRALATHPLLASTPLTLLLRTPPSPQRLSSLHALHPNLTTTVLDLSVGLAKGPSSPTGGPNPPTPAATALTALILSGHHDTIITCTGFAAPPGTQLLIANAVLAAAPVAQRFFPWQFGVDYDVVGATGAGGLMAEQVAVRTLLRKRAAGAGVEWTVVSTGMFVGFLFEDEAMGVVGGLKGVVEGGEDKEVVVRGLGGWGTRVTVTEVGDIGRVVAELLAAPGERNDEGGSVVFVAGETVSYGEIAEVMERVMGERGRKVRREEWGLEFLRAEMEREPESKIRKYRVLFGEGRGVAWDKEKTVNAQRGVEMMGVEEWLRRKLSK